MTLSQFLQYIEQYLNIEKTSPSSSALNCKKKDALWLTNIRFLCSKLGNPQDKIKCIHIAGSKGKGSVATLCASILEEERYKVGVYLSPHIADFRERITTPSGFFPQEIYDRASTILYNTLTSLEENLPPRPFTWFEVVTALAFVTFDIAKVDYAVYETGLGGRLDTTNIVTPLITIITRIEKEHTLYLGKTIKKIAGEKAGIIKPNIPLIIAPQSYKTALEVLQERAKKLNSSFIYAKEVVDENASFYNKLSYNYSPLSMNIKIKSAKYALDIKTTSRLLGRVQYENIITSAITLRTLLPNLTQKAIEKGIKKAFLPARFEEVLFTLPPKNIKKTLLLDGAHTVKSISNVVKTLKTLFPPKQNSYTLLFSCASDKDIKHIAPCLFSRSKRLIFDTVIVTTLGEDKECFPEKIKKEILDFSCSSDIEAKIKVISNIKEALLFAISSEPSIILVTGSFYLCAKVKKVIEENKKD